MVAAVDGLRPMLVSVITVVLNSEKTILSNIASVNCQSHSDIEHIFIDGGSVDGTLTCIEQQSRRRTTVLSEADEGIYDAMNKGLLLAKGEIICFLNADDCYANCDVIAHVVGLFSSSIKLVTSNVQFIDGGGRPARFYRSDGFRAWKFRFGFMPAHPGTFMRRGLVKEVGQFRTDLRIAGDFDYLFRVFGCLVGSELRSYNGTSVLMRVGGVSTAGLSAAWRITKELETVLKSHRVRTSRFLLLCRLPIKWISGFRRGS